MNQGDEERAGTDWGTLTRPVLTVANLDRNGNDYGCRCD